MIEAPVSESKSGVKEMLSKRCRYPSRSAPRHWLDPTRPVVNAVRLYLEMQLSSEGTNTIISLTLGRQPSNSMWR
jgi:hypothetical protein